MAKMRIIHRAKRAGQIYRDYGFAGLAELFRKRTKPLRRNAVGYGRYFAHRIIDKMRYRKSLADPYKTIWVPLQQIERMHVPNFYLRFSAFGTFVLSGEWDNAHSEEEIGFKFHESEKVGKIENYLVYQSVRQWLKEDVEWEDTWWAKTLRERNGVSAAAAKHEKLRNLAASIKENGYQVQQALKNAGAKSFTPWSVPPEHGEIVVDIGRDGDVLFDDGTHRFCIAKALGIQEVPVRVLIRHKEWQGKRYQMHKAKSIRDLNDTLARYVDHPDMQDVRPADC